VETVQVALFSLGFLPNTAQFDGSFGPRTGQALQAFLTRAGVKSSGKIDATALKALDKAASAQIESLKATQLPAGSKRGAYRVMVDIANLKKTRIYVLGQNDQILARYLTSPGKAPYSTRGSQYTVQEVLPRAPWIPPASKWAEGSKVAPPGIKNPMGILKLWLGGGTAYYFHGIPAYEEPELGTAASHGCLRMSGANILEFHENYAEAGTEVVINRDRTKSAKLEAAYAKSGLSDRAKNAGHEYLFGYLGGELGKNQKLSPPRVS
jgi:peptidoglycan hydrolase-like protein with peptidoglycan-binding domain